MNDVSTVPAIGEAPPSTPLSVVVIATTMEGTRRALIERPADSGWTRRQRHVARAAAAVLVGERVACHPEGPDTARRGRPRGDGACLCVPRRRRHRPTDARTVVAARDRRPPIGALADSRRAALAASERPGLFSRLRRGPRHSPRRRAPSGNLQGLFGRV